MNILEVHNAWDMPEPGGIVSMLRDLIGGLSKKHNTTLLVPDWSATRLHASQDSKGMKYFRLRLISIPTSIFPLKLSASTMFNFPISLIELCRFCKEKKIDIIHLHYASPIHSLFAFARLFGLPPYVITTHRGDVMSYPHRNWLARWSVRYAFKKASRVTSVSKWLAIETKIISPDIDDVSVIYNGYTPDIVETKTSLDIDCLIDRVPSTNYAVLVANCRSYKGHDIAIEAWTHLRASESSLQLVIIGGGPDLDKMKELVKSYGLSEFVTFLGPQPRAIAIELTARAFMMIVPSRNEGQGIVILEAGLSGVPVVCSDIPPFLEVIDDLETGFVFRSEEPGDLARIVELVENTSSEQIERVTKNLYNKVKAEYSVSKMVAGYESVFADILMHSDEV